MGVFFKPTISKMETTQITMAQQTATEWLMLEMLKPDMYRIWPTLLERAKEMEKKQIMNAYIDGELQQGFEAEAEQYYNETYNK